MEKIILDTLTCTNEDVKEVHAFMTEVREYLEQIQIELPKIFEKACKIGNL